MGGSDWVAYSSCRLVRLVRDFASFAEAEEGCDL